MKLKFDPSLEYQQQAINAIVGALEGQPIVQSNFEIRANGGDTGLQMSELGIGNRITLMDEHILTNIHRIQEANGIEKSKSFIRPAAVAGRMVAGLSRVGQAEDEICLEHGREFSIEMETGTGKTYVYLRTIFELNKNYGLKKFI